LFQDVQNKLSQAVTPLTFFWEKKGLHRSWNINLTKDICGFCQQVSNPSFNLPHSILLLFRLSFNMSLNIS